MNRDRDYDDSKKNEQYLEILIAPPKHGFLQNMVLWAQSSLLFQLGLAKQHVFCPRYKLADS